MARQLEELIEEPAPTPPPPASGEEPPYINRELSLLDFQERVLALGEDEQLPLLERAKFLAIFSTNLDEFFQVRVAGLTDQVAAGLASAGPDRLSPSQQLAAIRKRIIGLTERQSRAFLQGIVPALADAGIRLCRADAMSKEDRKHLQNVFDDVFPVLTPLAVDPGHPFPFLSNLSLSLAVEIRDPASQERKFARVKVPESLPRFVALEGLDKGVSPSAPRDASSLRFLPLEQLIEANLDQLFPELEILGHYPFRVTRDMDYEILAEEAVDLMSIIDRELRRRRFGACVRLEVDRDIPEHIRRMLLEKLEIDQEDLYETSGLLGLSTLMALAQLDRPDLRDPPFVPRIPITLGETQAPNVFHAIRGGNVLLHHPYDSFMPVLDFLNQAAVDPQVLAVKLTLYRAGSNADAARALIRAAENGKQVAVSIELKARFDEENNIAWARALERAGAHVFYGAAGIKTHAKVALVVRREADAIRRYVHLSTGNYNASTARLYTDLGLLTADPEIGEDVSELFNSLSGFSRQTRYRKLAVAPSGLLESIMACIEHEADEARAGRPAQIFAKMNSLVDGRVCRALYCASMAGVPIELVVRGICCLRPGLPGISENIRVRSLVGRFLEHPRVFVFGPAGRERFYLSSADWMPRNFNDRVEVLFPLESEALREQVRREVIEPALRPDVLAYELRADGSYQRLPEQEAEGIDAQTSVLERVATDPARRSLGPGRSLTPSVRPN
jgi:polyphosphate kinase